MKIILGQGNPGAGYASSRHNVGFLALDFFAKQAGLQFAEKKKFFGYLAEQRIGDEKVILVKPTTFYNQTGQTAWALADFYKLNPDDFLIVHDDLALPFGSVRTRLGGEAAGNNGVRSISSQLGPNTWRLRVGVSSELSAQTDGADFVLSGFNSAERITLKDELLPLSREIINQFIAGKISPTTHRQASPKHPTLGQ